MILKRFDLEMGMGGGVVTRHGWSQRVVVMVVTVWMCASAQAELKDRVKGLWDFENLSLSASVGK